MALRFDDSIKSDLILHWRNIHYVKQSDRLYILFLNQHEINQNLRRQINTVPLTSNTMQYHIFYFTKRTSISKILVLAVIIAKEKACV